MTKMMPSSIIITVFLLWSLLSQTEVHALALSDITLNSSINQPVNATIDLLYATPAELDSLNIVLAKTRREAVDRGVESKLKVELVRPEKGNSYLMITTKDNMREPVINFMLELSWATGRIQREYSLLLNLPY